MGECGCTMNDDRYTLPGPGKSIYLITLSAGCVDCDGPAGVSIERISPDSILYREYKRGEFTDGELKLEKWPDSEGVAIATGMRKHEFVKAVGKHLVGVSANDIGENGVIDEIGAEVIAEEMFDDSQVKPSIVKPVEPNLAAGKDGAA